MKGARDNADVWSIAAPRPLASKKLPLPRLRAMRSGNASASMTPVVSSPPPCGEGSGVGVPRTRTAVVDAPPRPRERASLASDPARGEGVEEATCDAQRCASPRAASARCERSRRNASSLMSRSALSPPSPRSVSTAAISAAARPVPNRLESTIMRASRGGSASARRLLPSSVMRPSPSSAPSSRSNSRASFSAGSGGLSRKARPAGSLTPHCARSSTSEDRSALRISGWVKAAKEAVCGSSHSR